MIGGVVDLDLLSSIPKFGQESLEGWRGIKLSRCATMEERECAKAGPPKIGEGVFKPLHKNWPLEDLAAAQNPQHRKYW